MDQDREPSRRRPTGLIVFVAVMFALLIGIALVLSTPERSYTDFIRALEAGKVERVLIDAESNTIMVRPKEGRRCEPAFPDYTQPELVDALRAQDVAIDVEGKGSNYLGTLLLFLLPVALLIAVSIFFMRRMGGAAGGGGLMQMGKATSTRPTSRCSPTSSRPATTAPRWPT
jgi:cell division protease FtsH